MTPINKDPKRRIRRIQRWFRFRKQGSLGPLTIISIEPLDMYPALHFHGGDYLRNIRRLMRVELDWLCDYALRITTEHGRATSRLGEADGALRRIGAAVHEISPQVSPRSTPDTLAYEVESACRIVEDARAMKKRV